jgi:hypothetical protein
VQGGPKQGEDRATLWISVLADVFQTFSFVFKKLCFGQTCCTCTRIECRKKSNLGYFFFHHPNFKFTNFQVLGNYMHFPPTSPTSLMCMVLNCQALLKYGHFELAPTTAHNEGWMVSDRGTVFCWVPVPLLAMVISSVAFFFQLPIY